MSEGPLNREGSRRRAANCPTPSNGELHCQQLAACGLQFHVTVQTIRHTDGQCSKILQLLAAIHAVDVAVCLAGGMSLATAWNHSVAGIDHLSAVGAISPAFRMLLGGRIGALCGDFFRRSYAIIRHLSAHKFLQSLGFAFHSSEVFELACTVDVWRYYVNEKKPTQVVERLAWGKIKLMLRIS